MTYLVDSQNLGYRIKARRKEFGISQAKLAELTGLSANYIGHIERAERAISMNTFLSICYALTINPDTLLQDSLPEGGFDENERYYLRESCCTLANTLTNWVCLDIPDITGQSNAPVDLRIMPPLSFMTLEECHHVQSAG